MTKHTVYFSTGEIIEYTGGRGSFKRKVREFVRNGGLFESEKIRCWFRPCEAWQKASAAYMEEWKKTHQSMWRVGA